MLKTISIIWTLALIFWFIIGLLWLVSVWLFTPCFLPLFFRLIWFSPSRWPSGISSVGFIVFSLLFVVAVIAAVLLLLLPGGVRSMRWSQCAFALDVVLGLVIPLVLVAVNSDILPFAPFTYGSLIDDLAKFEILSQ